MGTVGDSTLDNLIWQTKGADGNFVLGDSCIGKLRASLPCGSTVTNYAADGFTSANVLDGAVPFLSREAWRRHSEPFPVTESVVSTSKGDARVDSLRAGTFRPLDAIEALHKKAAPPVSHVLLSVGGNDIREILTCLHRLPAILEMFSRNYLAICERLLALPSPPRLLLMLQYQPCLAHDAGCYGVYSAIGSLPGPGNAQQKLHELMQRIYAPVLAFARKHRLAIVDLPRTFDPARTELYRCQIEPSCHGSALIADVVTHLMATHDFDGPSVLYSRSKMGVMRHEPNNFCTAARPERWTVVRAVEVRSDEESAGASMGKALLDPASVDVELQAREAYAEALPPAMSQLMEMGFAEGDVRHALLASGNLPQQALERLLDR